MRMNNLIYVLLVSLFFVSCVDRDERGITYLQPEKTVVPLSVNHVRIAELLASRSVVVPAVGKIGFFVKGDSHYAEVNNRQGVFSADRQRWIPNDSIWLNNTAAQIGVYYPYDLFQDTSQKLILKAIKRPVDGSKDLWSNWFTADNVKMNIDLELKQLYTRLRLTFVLDTDALYTGDANMTRLYVTGADIYSGALYTPVNGAYGEYTGIGIFDPGIEQVKIVGTDATSLDAVCIDLLMIPTVALTEPVTIVATVDGKVMRVTIPKDKLGGTLAAGRLNNIVIKLRPTSLVFSDIEIEDWNVQTEFEAGGAEFTVI
jgi:hypothetical protein